MNETQQRSEPGIPLDATMPRKPDWEYIRVEVTRTESTSLYLKVPKGWRPSGIYRELMGHAAKETTTKADWDNSGWESSVEAQGHKLVDAEEAEQYQVFDLLPLMPLDVEGN